MAPDKLQASRFELKYFVNETVALQIRDFVSAYLDLDENSVGKPDYAYPVHSLYLDTDDLQLYWETINGDKNRFKLRVRFYNDNPEAPAFFEIKRRTNHCILKQRGGVKREAVAALLAGLMPSAEHLISRDPGQELALLHFCELMQEIEAKPKAHVSYRREAYAPPNDNSIRVTLDRGVCLERRLSASLATRLEHAVRVWGRAVVLELKFTNRFPDWMGDLVRTFDLQQSGAAKYVDGVALLGESRLDRRWASETEAVYGEFENEILLSKPEQMVLMDEEKQ